MYTLYYMPGACSLATQVILRELGQDVKLIDKDTVENYEEINPVGAVPVIIDGEQIIREGASIILYLLDKHENTMMPYSGTERDEAIENVLFSNATMHPAYSRLFFINASIEEGDIKQKALDSAAAVINDLWRVVEKKLGDKEYLGGESFSAADILLTVYSTWGAMFPVEITIGEKTLKMIERVKQLPSFTLSVSEENHISQVA